MLSFPANTASRKSKQSLGLDSRLAQPRDIARVRLSGRRIRVPLLTVWITRGTKLQPRVAVLVALHGHSAVARNKLKRRLRHIMRSDILPVATEPFDAVVSARSSAYSASFDALKAAVVNAFVV
ncbi:MAG: ribonuclease P protein component [Gemmatimonadaceae bacterium]